MQLAKLYVHVTLPCDDVIVRGELRAGIVSPPTRVPALPASRTMMSSALPLVASSTSTSGPARPPPITASVSCPIQKSTLPVANYAAETTHLTLSTEKLLENAEATGELRLCCRNLKVFPKNCCKFHLEDTVMTGKVLSR